MFSSFVQVSAGYTEAAFRRVALFVEGSFTMDHAPYFLQYDALFSLIGCDTSAERTANNKATIHAALSSVTCSSDEPLHHVRVTTYLCQTVSFGKKGTVTARLKLGERLFVPVTGLQSADALRARFGIATDRHLEGDPKAPFFFCDFALDGGPSGIWCSPPKNTTLFCYACGQALLRRTARGAYVRGRLPLLPIKESECFVPFGLKREPKVACDHPASTNLFCPTPV